MPEPRLSPPPPRADLLRLLRYRLAEVVPGWRPLAEDVLGAETRIDFVGAEPDGRAVLVLVGGAGEDLELVARGLAHRAWLSPRVRDWLQLAPELPLRPEAGVRLVLLCPSFGPEAVAAATALGPGVCGLATLRFVRDGSGAAPLVDPLGSAAPAPAAAPDRRAPDPIPSPEPVPVPSPTPPPAMPAAAPFRTGLRDEDLDPTPEERAEFE